MDQLKFISLIKSESLKQCIEETNHVFSDYELLVLAFKYANNYNERLELIKFIQDNTSSADVRETAAITIKKELKHLDLFIKKNKKQIFEVVIQTQPNTYEESYLSDSYQNAILIIALFYKEYGGSPSETSRLTIKKRKVITIKQKQGFEEDLIGEATLTHELLLDKVAMYTFEPGKYLEREFVKFPEFLRKGVLVSWNDYDFKQCYGVVLNIDDDSAEVVHLDNIYITEKRITEHDEKGFYFVYNHHDHIDYPDLELVDKNQLSKEIIDDYNYLIGFLKKENQL